MKAGRGIPRWRRRGPLVAAIIAVGLLSACSAASTSGGSTSSASGSTTLTIEGSPTGPIADNFNPFVSTSPAVLLGASGMVYEPLMQYDYAKPGTVYPWLATSDSWSNADKTLTVQLRKGVKWSNGTAFTSKDVAFTFTMLKNSPSINSLGISFTSVSAPNPYEVVFQFASTAYVQSYNILGGTDIVPASQWGSVKNPATFADPNPIGTGPYLLSSLASTGMTLVKNPNYWQPGEPKIDKLVYPVFDSNTSANTALESGGIDWAGNFLPHIQQLYKDRDPSQRFYEFVPDRTAYLALNLTKYPFNLLPVRQALSLALNRPAVIDAGEYGEQPAALSPTGLIVPEQSSLLNPEDASLSYATNVSQALSLLKSAGFTDSGGKLLEPNGKPFAFTLIGPSAYTDVMADDQVVAQQWDALGADVTVQGEAVGSWLGQTFTGDYDVSLTESTSIATADPYSAYNQVLNSAFASPVGQSSVGDVEHFDSPAVDSLLGQWADSPTAAGRQAAMAGVEQAMVAQVPLIPLFYNVWFCEWSTSTVTGWPTASNPYDVPEPAGPEAEYVVLHLTPAA
jgi:peptide/nickel transport system substrate-binding protein